MFTNLGKKDVEYMAKEKGYPYTVKLGLRSHRYAILPSDDVLAKEVSRKRNDREFYEVLSGEDPVYFFLDIESTRTRVSPIEIEGLLQTLRNDFKKESSEDRSFTFAVLDASRELEKGGYKHSYHIHCQDVYFKDIRSHKLWVDHFLMTASPEFQEAIDSGVYHGGRLFRCFNQRKDKEPGSELRWETLTTDTYDVERTFITCPRERLEMDNPPVCLDPPLPAPLYREPASSDSQFELDELIEEAEAEEEGEQLDPPPFATQSTLAFIYGCESLPTQTPPQPRTIREWHALGFLGVGQFYAMLGTWGAWVNKFKSRYVNLPEDPKWKLEEFNQSPYLSYEVPREEAGCGIKDPSTGIAHYHPHNGGGSGGSCVTFRWNLESSVLIPFCQACRNNNHTRFEYFVQNRFSDQLTQARLGTNKNFTPQLFKQNKKEFGDATTRLMLCEAYIETTGCPLWFNRLLGVYAPIGMTDIEKRLKFHDWKEAALKVMYKWYAALGMTERANELVNGSDQYLATAEVLDPKVFNKYKGILTRARCEQISKSDDYRYMLMTTLPANADSEKYNKVTQDLFPLNAYEVVNLETGESYPMTLDACFTSLAKNYISGMRDTSQVEKFVQSVLIDKEHNTHFESQLEFLECVIGYLMTGRTNERCAFFCIGAGSNGKSALMELVSRTLGDLSTVISPSFFRHEKMCNQEKPTAAALAHRGKRLGLVHELRPDDKLDTAKLKMYCSGDKISGRNLFSKITEEFATNMKVVINSNHYPSHDSVDKAIQDRLLFIPFEKEFVPKRDDVDISADPTKAYRDSDLIDRLTRDMGQVTTYMLRCAKKYLTKLKESGTSAILRNLQPAKWRVKCEEELQALDVESALSEYVYPIEPFVKDDGDFFNTRETLSPNTITYQCMENFILPSIRKYKTQDQISIRMLKNMVKELKWEWEDSKGEKRVWKWETVSKLQRTYREENDSEQQQKKTFVKGLALNEDKLHSYSMTQKEAHLNFEEWQEMKKTNMKRHREYSTLPLAKARFKKFKYGDRVQGEYQQE